MMAESHVQSNSRSQNCGLEAIELDTADDIEDFSSEETQHSITNHTAVTEFRSNKLSSYSVSQFFDNLQNKACGRISMISQPHLITKGNKKQLSMKRGRFPLGNRDVDSEDFSETSGASSDDESKNQVQMSVFPEIIRKTMSDQVHEILTAYGMKNDDLVFSGGKRPSLFESLQQVIQPEREKEVDICRMLQQDKLPGEKDFKDVKIMSKYLDGKLTVCQCIFKVHGEDWSVTARKSDWKNQTVIFNSRVCSADLEVGNLIRIHPPWKEVQINEGGDDEAILLCIYFFQQYPIRVRCSPRTDEYLEARDAPPLHFTFKIQAFSQLSNDPVVVEKLVSDKFESGDYNWKLSIYPNGDKSRGGGSHVSTYLSLVDTSSLPVGWQVNVVFNIFVFDHISDKYFYLKDGRVRRFHAMKTEWGHSKFVDFSTFQNPSNGFLLEDSCVFGAEVFVLKQARKAELLSMVKEPISANYVWKLKNFSTLTSERYESDLFFSGDYRWKMRIYPGGNGDGKGNSISLFMCADEATLSPDTRLFVRYTLRVVDQNNSKHAELKADYVFGVSNPVWGSQKFVTLAKFRDPRKGLLVDNGCVIEAELMLLGLLNVV